MSGWRSRGHSRSWWGLPRAIYGSRGSSSWRGSEFGGAGNMKRLGSISLAMMVLLGAGRGAPPAKQLKIVRIQLHQYDGGPPLASGTPFLIGDLIFVTFQIAGYQVSAESKIDLSFGVDALDPNGVPFVEAMHGKIETQISPEDKDWMPLVNQSAAIPPLAWGGTYRLKLAVEDNLSKQTAKAEIEIPVRGRNIEASPTLTVRNFRFLRTEEDGEPLLDAVFHPGDAVWIRFDFTGFRYGAKNHIHVEYGVSLVDSAGKSLFSQPQAAAEDEDAFYPKRYLSGALSLNLEKKIKPGQYVVVLALKDYEGDQSQETRHEFRVE